MATETKTFYPQAYTGSTFNSITNATNPVGKGSSNTTSASLVMDLQSRGAVIYWPFDLSAVPDNATIDSVVCKAKCSVSSTSYVKSNYLQLFSGTTAKGSQTSAKTTRASVYTLTVGTWTRGELSNCRLCISSGHQYGANPATVYFYGADLTVTYTYQSEKFMLKLSGAYNDVARTFKKVSGIWVEQTDLANVIEDGVRYKNGGEIIVPQTVKVTGTGSTQYAYAKIDGEIFTSATTKTVAKGDIVELYIGADSGFTSNCNIMVDGVEVKLGVGTYQFVVDSDCTIALNLMSVSDAVRFGYIVVTTTGGGGESTPTLISFTMTGGLSWQAEEGMTWGEWIDSEYATANSGVTFEPTNNSIEVYQNGRWWGTLTDQSENFIKTADKIVGGYNYWIV